jgi:hypothetical protein
MIDIGKILKRSWHILWNYKVLWIFGILLAITAGGSGGGSSGSSYQFSGNTERPSYDPATYQIGPQWEQFTSWFEQEVAPLFEHPDQYFSAFIWIGVALLVFILVLAVIFTFVRYVSETAVLRMVDQYEQDGTMVKFKQGWKLGWTRRAFRLWVIDLLISLPALFFVALLLGMGVLAFISLVNGTDTLEVAGVVSAIGCTFLFIFVFTLGMVFLGLLRQFIARSAALEERRVGESFRRGWTMFKRNWKSAALMWLVMVGIGIGYGIASMILFFLLIPVYVILLIPAVLVAAIPGLIGFGIANLFAGTILSVIIGIIVALPFLFTVIFAPLYLVGAWYKVYESSVWTLTYREMKTLENLQPDSVEKSPSTAT